MAYVTASVSSRADLLTFIQNACTANGWTLSGSIIHKGNVHIRILDDGTRLNIRAGTGKDGSNNLTGACANDSRLADYLNPGAVAYPLIAEAHINTDPDEVYIVINYSVSYYQFAAWGQSDVPGLTGTGVWMYASRADRPFGTQNFNSSPGGGTLNGDVPNSYVGCAMFWCSQYVNGAIPQSHIHSDVDSQGWQTAAATCHFTLQPLLSYLPNLWNGETVLLPYSVYASRTAGSKWSLVADFKHIRNCRIDYNAPGDIVTLGVDKWKLYPWYRKDTSARDGGSTHSGTLAYAIRYTGP